MSDFIHLHAHSFYSYLDGQPSPLEMLAFAKELGQTHCAVTDHGTLASHHDLFKAAEETGIKPIPGMEAYITYDRFKKKVKKSEVESVYNHIILLPKNDNGLKTLRRLNEEAYTNGFYYKPRIDLDVLEDEREDLIVLSGCFNGLISKALERKQDDHAEELTLWFKERFGDDFYMEIQPHNPEWLNAGLLRLADEHGIKPVVTQDCHYTDPKNRDLEEFMLILSTHPKKEKNLDYFTTQGIKDIFARLNRLYPDRVMTFQDIDVYMSGRADLQGKMEAVGIERTDIYDNTVEIANKIEGFDVLRGLNLLPKFSEDPDSKLWSKATNGLKERGLFEDERYRERLREELEVIRDKNFSTYFLIVADMVEYAKGEGILVGGGRGSAAGSLVCYCLGITEFDPIEYKLLFYRFISPERNDYPDIDIDFEDRRRNEVKDYLRSRWGNVANIATFSVFKDKMVVKDVSRVLSVPLSDVNRATKQIEFFEELETSSDSNVVQFRENYPEVIPYAERLRGKVRNTGVHPAGMVISEHPLWNYVPVETAKDTGSDERVPVVAYDMKMCAEIGLIKVDVLGLKTLSVIDDCLDLVEERWGKRIDINEIRFDDPKVFEQFSIGNTLGTFQTEAAPYRRLLKSMGVRDFEELAASNALVRPGALQTGAESFIKRQHGKEVVTYPHEILEPILKDTYGVFIYQEQLMQAAVEMGGFSWAEADKLREIIGKKKDKSEFDAYKDKWLDGASRYISRANAASIWNDFEKFAGYAFNRSHAISYSALSYQTMWLKHYYPLEYICALLRNESNPEKRTSYILEAQRIGIELLPPHVNESKPHIYPSGVDALRFGLMDIKYVSTTATTKILEARPFDSYEHFMEVKQTKNSKITKRTVEALEAVGALEFKDNHCEITPEGMNEYLGLPKFSSVELPESILEKAVPLEEYDEKSCQILHGIIKGVSKRAGWVRVDIEDETAAEGVFADDGFSVEDGASYFVLHNYKSVMKCASDEEVANAMDNGTDDGFIKLLISDGNPVEEDADLIDTGLMTEFNNQDLKTLTYLVSIQYRKTKKGFPMANAVFLDGTGKMEKVLIFQKELGQVINELEVGKNIIVKTGSLRDGTLVLHNAIASDKYRKLKGR